MQFTKGFLHVCIYITFPAFCLSLRPFGAFPQGTHPGEAAKLVQQVEDAHGPFLDEVQHVLVVHELDVGPVDALLLVLGLLHLKHVLVEVLLQLLVCQVDAKLLEVVLLEALEAYALADPA